MRALILIALIVTLVGFGCAKKEAVQTESMEEPTQEVASESATVQSTVPAAVEPSMPSTEASTTQAAHADITTQAATQVSDEKIEKNKKIQTALTNAGFYKSSIDGKIGPKTKKAIREFQAAKGLNVDGKVGPKTWAELEKYLTGPASAATQE